MNLNDCRQQLDALDDELTALFAKRMDIVRDVAAYKQAHGLPITHSAREQAIITRLQSAVPQDVRPHIETLYQAIFDASKAYQAQMLFSDVRFGLIGESLTHSLSPRIHTLLGNGDYRLLPMDGAQLDAFLRAWQFEGVNVTIPYKKLAYGYCDFWTADARRTGCVNTIVCRDGKLCGDNTDIFGMKTLLNHEKIDLKDKKVAILGSGGTAQTAKAVAEDLGAKDILTVSRTGALTYSVLAEKHADTAILINTTPVGMYPNTTQTPLSLAPFQKLQAVVDAVYNPLETTLMREARGLGIPACGGLRMLVAQAFAAAQQFQNTVLDAACMEPIIQALTEEML